MSSASRSEGAFDHAAISVRDRIDDAAQAFARLGFTLTPRGHHTLGSINHLMVLQDTYLELIGFAADRPDVRPELRDAPFGLNGLVFASVNAHATHAQAGQRGAPLQPVQEFSRPVAIDGHSHEARFRTVRTVPGASPAGRVYFCEHLTPQWVWRMPWQWHANAALEVTGATVRVRDLAAEAALYRSLLGDDRVVLHGDELHVLAPPATIVVRVSPLPPAMLGLSIRVADLHATARVLRDAGAQHVCDATSILVEAAEAFDVGLRFHT